MTQTKYPSNQTCFEVIINIVISRFIPFRYDTKRSRQSRSTIYDCAARNAQTNLSRSTGTTLVDTDQDVCKG